MQPRDDAVFSPEMGARVLAMQATKLAQEGRRKESKQAFRRAFEMVREVRGPTQSLKSDVHVRSKLATVLADQAVEAGFSATFAMEMWELGCNSGCLTCDEKGDTDMFYPVEIMAMAAGEKRAGNGVEEDAAPPAVCEVEKEKRIPIPWPIRFVVSNFRNLFFGEDEAGERERTGKNE